MINATILIHPDDVRQVTSNTDLGTRENPDINSNIIGHLSYGEKVIILKIEPKEVEIDDLYGYWVYIQSNNVSGWIFDGYLDYIYLDIWRFKNNNIISHAMKYLDLPVHIFLNDEKAGNRNYKFVQKADSKLEKYRESIIRRSQYISGDEINSELGIKAVITVEVQNEKVGAISVKYKTMKNSRRFFEMVLFQLKKYNNFITYFDENWVQWDEPAFSRPFQLFILGDEIQLDIGVRG
jgi:hypothetical protein